MIKLRGHHLVCLHFFEGKGYNEQFIKNMQDTSARLENAEIIEIVTGADDICFFCPHLTNNRCTRKASSHIEIENMDNTAMKKFNVTSGEKIYWQDVKKKFYSMSGEWLDEFCKNCPWKNICIKHTSNFLNS
ncbi:MAG: DUF1284 domain-containing protein [Clostridiales bacterium]|nr:DUF1284 domain-containing protein [Clostridiales bacterium]MCF8023104.1 DUF1284 domain-containing protein [Clostridiales bacterium]